MPQINRSSFSQRHFATVILLTLASCRSFGNTRNVDVDAWIKFSTGQKSQSLVGFIHCYRTALPSKDAFGRTDIGTVIHIVDAALAQNEDQPIGDLILQALKRAPHAKVDTYAEHWQGIYGFNDGMWWRGADDKERQAYLQGVLWCAETAPGKSISVTTKSVPAMIQKLDDWYLISDEDWKDPRSNKRADVPVFSAMEEMGIILHIQSNADKPRKL